MAGTAATSWSVADNADFTFGAGAFTLIVLTNMTDATNCVLSAKTFTLNQNEFFFHIDGNDRLAVYCAGALDFSTYIGRGYATALTADQGSWHCYGASHTDTGTTNASLKLYRDGVQVDDNDRGSGVFASMQDGTSAVGNFYSSDYSKAKYGVVIIINKELTAAEVSRLSKRLLAYAGLFQ
jgi:hypothetical protein